jgi:NDP-sugar pyrophosphorylase family protein
MLPVAILAGGLATRLRPLTETIPKSLVEINAEPFLWHQLRLLRENGIDRVVLCVSHLGEMVRDSVGDGSPFGLHIDYSFDGPTLLGTAGALKRAQPLLGESFLRPLWRFLSAHPLGRRRARLPRKRQGRAHDRLPQ